MGMGQNLRFFMGFMGISLELMGVFMGTLWWLMSTLDFFEPLARLFNWEGAIQVSNHDYWGNTPLINKPWFIDPGLTLPYLEEWTSINRLFQDT